MATVKAPPYGRNFRITKRGSVDGAFVIDGVRHFRALCLFRDIERKPNGKLRTPKQLNAAVQALWEDKRIEIEAKAGLAKGSDHPVSAVFDEWIRLSEAVRSPGTLAFYRQIKSNYLVAVGDHRMRDLAMLHIDRFLAWQQKQGLVETTVNMRLRTLNTFLNWALERELITKKPRIRTLRTTKKLPKVLSDAEVTALFERLAHLRTHHPNHRQRARYALHERFLMVVRYTGARLSEVFWLRWQQIDFEEGVIRVEKQARFNVKERREKNLPVPLVLAEYLAAERRAAPNEVYLLDNGKGELAYRAASTLSQCVRRHLQSLGVDGRGIKPVHGFRAYFAGELRNRLGLDLHTVKTWLGHSNISVTEGYFPDPEGRLRDGVRQYDRMTRKRRKTVA